MINKLRYLSKHCYFLVSFEEAVTSAKGGTHVRFLEVYLKYYDPDYQTDAEGKFIFLSFTFQRIIILEIAILSSIIVM